MLSQVYGAGLDEKEKMSSSSIPCAACKLLRRKCTKDCVFAPHFPPQHPKRFHDVHRVFGASNVSKLLSELDPALRQPAADSLVYEAECRLRNPTYGCVAFISLLHQRLLDLNQQLQSLKQELVHYVGPEALNSILQTNPDRGNPSALTQLPWNIMQPHPQQQESVRDPSSSSHNLFIHQQNPSSSSQKPGIPPETLSALAQEHSFLPTMTEQCPGTSLAIHEQPQQLRIENHSLEYTWTEKDDRCL